MQIDSTKIKHKYTNIKEMMELEAEVELKTCVRVTDLIVL